jgi:hypothetical protein
MPRIALLVTLLGALAGCSKILGLSDEVTLGGGDGDPDDDGAKSGTRIKLQWHDYGGTRVFAGTFDTERHEVCNLQNWIDGKFYCAPDSANNDEEIYSDAQCTQRALITHASDPNCPTSQPGYAVDRVAGPCTHPVIRLYLFGPRIAATHHYTRSSDGSCTGPHTTWNSDYFQLGAEVPVSALAELTLDAPSGTGRLSPVSASSADGARVVLTYFAYDAVLGGYCGFFPEDGDSSAPCRPFDSSGSSEFHDAMCSQAVVRQIQGCPKPKFAAVQANPGCDNSASKYFSVGDMVAAPPLYSMDGGPTCTVTMPSPDYTYYALGPEVSLMQLARAPDNEPGRALQLIRYTDGATRYRSFWGGLYDSQHSTACYEDSSLHCVPTGDAWFHSYYSDSACTQPINVAEVHSGPAVCGALKLPAFARKSIAPQPGSCKGSAEFYPVRTAYTQPIFEKRQACVEVQLAAGSLLYTVGAPYPITEFPLATLVTDP